MVGCSIFCQPKSIQLNVYACYIVIIKQAPSIFVVFSAPLPVFRPLQTTSRTQARVYFERSHRTAFRFAVLDASRLSGGSQIHYSGCIIYIS